MASINHSDRKVLASLNNLYTNEKYRGCSTESVPWNTDRGRSYSDIKTSSAADHRTSATSPASLRSKNQTSRRSVKHITCHYWANGGCRKTSEKCYYAHEITDTLAQKPVQVEPGRPSVAGKNASNPHPVYINWKQERSLPSDPNHRSEVQQRVDHIKAKTIPNSPDTKLQDYIRNLKTMHSQHSNSAPESVHNPLTNHGMLNTQPTMSRHPADFLPSVGYFASRENAAFHQPFGQDATNYSQATHYGGDAPAHQSTQQTSPGHHQAYCPQPIDHLMFENLKYEQTKMMRAKDQAIYRFASAIDFTIQTMEESQKSNEEDIQSLIDVAKVKVEGADLAGNRGYNESPYRGRGKLFDSEGSCQSVTHVPAPAPKRKITGTSMLCYDTNHDLPAIAEKLSQTHQTAEHNITRLKNAKQILGFAFENIGEQDLLPQGWIQH